MQDELPDLWPREVDETAVLSPVAILRHQAGLLRRRTRNLLEAEVVTEDSPRNSDYVQHGLEVVVPALDQFRVRLLTSMHSRRIPYPAWTDFGSTPAFDSQGKTSTQGEFLTLLSKLLASDSVRATIHGLLAQANDESETSTTAAG